MKLIQKPPVIDSSSLIRVNTDTFAELLSQTDTEFTFNVNFKLALSSGNKDLRDYNKVVITVKNKESVLSITSQSTNFIGPNALEKTNPVSNSGNDFKLLKPNNGMLTPKYTDKVTRKLYSGLKLVNDLQVREDYIDRVEISLNSYVEEATKNKFNYTEIYSTTYKPKRKLSRKRDIDVRNVSFDENNQIAFKETNPSKIDPTNLLQRINKELCDITYPVMDPSLSFLNSESLLDNEKIRLQEVSKGRSALYFDILKYYLDEIPVSKDEDGMTWYESRNTTKFLDSVDVSEIVRIKKTNRNQNLTFRFDLYKRNSQLVDETFSCDLTMSTHTEAFNCIIIPPTVSVTVSKNVCFLTITDNEPQGKIQGYNVYAKDVSKQGSVENYRKVLDVKNVGRTAMASFNMTSNLTVVRIIPKDFQNRESHTFTNVIAGTGHDNIGNLTILPIHFGKNGIRIEIVNLPPYCLSTTLYRRDCTENQDSKFSAVSKVRLDHGITSTTMIDPDVLIGRIYEYYAVVIFKDQETDVTSSQVSNYVMLKNISGPVVEKAINVNLTDQNSFATEEDYVVSFKLTTEISKTENEKITQTLKEQIGELYDQYLNPANNSSSPLGDDSKGVPRYSDLFFHEIVRTNLNTSERETFDIVSDGVFEDSALTRQIFNIKPINPQHSYTYQVFTYKKNPIELFKKFVAWGIDNKGREWFYLPYKWKNPSVKLGKLYADDATGIPVIDAYDNFTSETFGLTATHQVNDSREYTELTRILADRIDRNTVKISWNFSALNSQIYDSFVVMKVVNGIRSFVGRSHKNFIYHELNSNDLGTIYYIVVPIMSEFDIDNPGYSNSILVSPDGLTKKTKIGDLFTKNKFTNPVGQMSVVKVFNRRGV